MRESNIVTELVSDENLKRSRWMQQANVHEVQRDLMPREVAVELLATPGLRMSNRERKIYRDALTRYYISNNEKKPRVEKLQFKLQASSWGQLNKWLVRTARRHDGLQTRYSDFAEKTSKLDQESAAYKVADLKLSAMRLAIGAVQQTLQLLEDEVDRRAAKAAAADKISTEEVTV